MKEIEWKAIVQKFGKRVEEEIKEIIATEEVEEVHEAGALARQIGREYVKTLQGAATQRSEEIDANLNHLKAQAQIFAMRMNLRLNRTTWSLLHRALLVAIRLGFDVLKFL